MEHEQNNDLNKFQTVGDEPIDMMEDFENVEPEEAFINNQHQQYPANYSSNNDLQDDTNPGYYGSRGMESSQKLQIDSLQQLMGAQNPKDFAKEFVYGDQRKLIKNLEKSQQAQYERENSQFNSMQKSQKDNFSLAQRFQSPQQYPRNFGNELNVENDNNQPQSSYTIYSKKIKTNFKEKNNDRAFTASKNPEIILNPTNVIQETQAKVPYDYSVEQQKNLSTRLSLEHDLFKKKKDDLKKHYQQLEDEKCTFTPAINRKANDYYDKDRFERVMDQKKIEIMKKNDQLKEDLDNKITDSLQAKPHISEKTKKLADKKKQKQGGESQTVVDRLFMSKSGQQLQTEEGTSFASTTQTHAIQGLQQTNYEDPECTFKPAISQNTQQLVNNMRRVGTVDHQLYNDAKQRQIRKKEIEQSQKPNQRRHESQQSINMLQSQSSQPQQQNMGLKSTYNQNKENKVSVQANIDRFRKEVETAYYAIVRNNDDKIDASTDSFLNAKLSYYEMVEMMKVMYFLSASPNEDWASSHHNSSALLSQKIWYQLNGHKNNYVLCRNLLVFLYAVQNIHVTKDTVELIGSESRREGGYSQSNTMTQSNTMMNHPYNQSYNNENDQFRDGNSERISHSEINNNDYEENNFNHNQQYQQNQNEYNHQMEEQDQINQDQYYQQDQFQQPSQPVSAQKPADQLGRKVASELKPDERPQTNFSPGHIFDSKEYIMEEQNEQDQNSNERRFQEKLNNIKQVPKIIGYYDSQGNLHLTEENALSIHNMYKPLYVNKLSGTKGATHYRKLFKQTNLVPPEDEYTPQISEISKQIASNKRERIINHIKQANQGNQVTIDLNTILCYQQKLGEEDKKILKCEYEDEQLEECTFQPQTKNYNQVSKHYKKPSSQFSYQILDNKQNQITSTNPSGVNRTQELYQLAKPHIQKRDRLRQEIEYEKECDECTFQPDISSNKKQSQQNSLMFGSSQYNHTQNMMMSQNSNALNSPYKNNSTLKVNKSQQFSDKKQLQPQVSKSELKEIDRIKKARLEKELRDKQKASGNTYNDKKTYQIQNDLENKNGTYTRLPKQKRKAPTNSGNVSQYSRSNNSSQFKKMASGNNSGLQSPYYDQYIQDTHGSQDEPNEYMLPKPAAQNPYLNQNRNYNMNGSNGLSSSQPASASHTQKTAEEDKVPLLFVDVNIEEGKTARIIVYEDDSSEELATRFTQEHGLDPSMKHKLKDLLDQQINSLLTKIDEEAISDSSSVKNE